MRGRLLDASRAAEMARDGRLAIVSDWLTVPGGAEETLRHIVDLLPAPIYVAQYNPSKFPWLQGRDVQAHWISGAPLSKKKHYVYAPVLADVYRRLKILGFDAVVTMSHTFAHNVRPKSTAVEFVYYHSLARALWLPEIDGRAGKGRARELLIKRLKRLDMEASKRPDYRVANSHTTAERIQRFYGQLIDEVIYPPVEVERWNDVQPQSGRLGYLVWGRLIPYKKFDLAIQAAQLGGFPLQVVGAGPDLPRLKEMASGSPNITFHGRLPDADLKAVMSECRGVIFPAYEDFGIVPVEGMAAGLPIIAFSAGGAGETVGDTALGEPGGTLFHHQTPAHLCEAVEEAERLEFDPDRLKARAAPFNVERFQREFMTALERAIERGPKRIA